MTAQKMERIIRARRRAQGIGALGGTLTVFAILSAVYGGDMVKEAKKLKQTGRVLKKAFRESSTYNRFVTAGRETEEPGR